MLNNVLTVEYNFQDIDEVWQKKDLVTQICVAHNMI
jgi:hypothetical protein